MISVLIVTYNSEGCIGACLESLLRHGADSSAEIVVVDNGSKDATVGVVRRFPRVKLIASPGNLGFAAGVNRAARESRGEALLLLNPDTICRTALAPFEEALRRSEKVVAVAPKLVNVEGEFQRGFAIRRLPTRAALVFEILLLNRLFPGNPVNRRYRCLDFNADEVSEVEQPAGACLLVRRSSFVECGGMDEKFFPLWFEDVDLCRRLREKGGIILYQPQVCFKHSGGHSLEAVTFSEKQVYWYRNLLYYVHKHYSRGTGALMRGALLVGIGLRVVAELIAAVLNRKTPVRVRGERLRAYGRAALVSISAGESRPRVRA
ncbi:MAG: glycosyltransferase family 2 protein [Acidobacteria bacterium]|nr:glycosyltransferase family 2 protein [Acidobacteriota bacterium]